METNFWNVVYNRWIKTIDENIMKSQYEASSTIGKMASYIPKELLNDTYDDDGDDDW